MPERRSWIRAAAAAALIALLPRGCSSGERQREAERERMVREDIAARGISDRRILESMRKVQRHLFVPGRGTDDIPAVYSPCSLSAKSGPVRAEN